jgi:hypothetical protein
VLKVEDLASFLGIVEVGPGRPRATERSWRDGDTEVGEVVWLTGAAQGSGE